MKIKLKEQDGGPERAIAIGAIMDVKVLRDLERLWNPDYIESRHIRLIIEWSLDYYKRYQHAPAKAMESIYAHAVRKGQVQPDDEPLMERLLGSLSDEWVRVKKFNSAYAIDQMLEHFRARSLTMACEDAVALVAQGKIDEAEGTLGNYKTISRDLDAAVNPFTDEASVFDAFDEGNNEPLFTFPGAYGRFINEQLKRENFIGILAPEKRGKTWMLLEYTMAALKARCNVAFFEAGDMSMRQIIRRFHIRLAGKSDRPKYCGDVIVPVLDCKHNQANECRMKCRRSSVGLGAIDEEESQTWEPEEFLKAAPRKYAPCAHCSERHKDKYEGTVWWEHRNVGTPLGWREAFLNGKKFSRRMTNRHFKLECHPNDTLTLPMIRARLKTWERTEGWTPDVIVCDYADLLAPEDRRVEFRHQENQKWKGFRAITQEFHCLGITATQASAMSYDANVLKLKHFSEDKRKYAHVTGMLGLNQDGVEKSRGIMRHNWLVLREDDFEVTKTVKLLQSIQTGRPFLGSYN